MIHPPKPLVSAENSSIAMAYCVNRGVLQLDFGDAEQQAGDQMLDRAAKINLLRTAIIRTPRWHRSASTLNAFPEAAG